MLEQRARLTPQRVAFTYLGDDGSQVVITDGELDLRARAVAHALEQLTEPGARAVLLYPPGLDFLVGFFGCLYAGVLPVPSSYPKPRRPLPRHAAIVSDCQATVALSTSQTQYLLNLGDEAPALHNLQWLNTDALDSAPPDSWQPHEARPEDVAFLQYTSGSTSEPKGVMLTQANVLHNMQVIRQSFNVSWLHANDLERTSVFWLPAYHDMGLIGGLLATLHTERHAVLMSPASFLQRPFRWLRAMSEYRATVSGAPNFAYELCVQRTTPAQRSALDLSHWKLAFCGAEPIRNVTLQRFAAAFAECGFRREAFYPCYGLAENTLMVSGGDGAHDWKTLGVRRDLLTENRIDCSTEATDDHETVTLVGCGEPRCGQQVRIVHSQTQQLCAADEVGEIWVKGPSVGAGYWNRRAESAATFQATLADGEGPYLRTGDLGFFRDGQLYITGRSKDLIIIRGQNHYPQDIELTATSAHEALVMDAAAAFSIDGPRGERLVLVQEVRRGRRDTDWEEVVRQVRLAVAIDHELDIQAVALLRQGSLPRTSSGKVQRRRARQQFLAQEWATLHVWSRPEVDKDHGFPPLALCPPPHSLPDLQRTATQIERVLLGWLRDQAGVAEDVLQRDKPFAEMGIDSLSAVELSYALESWLELELSPVVAWSFPTPLKMAEHLAGRLTGLESRCPNTSPTESRFERLLAEIESLDEEQAAAELRKMKKDQ